MEKTAAPKLSRRGGGRGGLLAVPLPSHGAASYAAAVLLVGGATALCEQARPYLSPVNMVMAYLLAVVLAAVFLGRGE